MARDLERQQEQEAKTELVEKIELVTPVELVEAKDSSSETEEDGAEATNQTGENWQAPGWLPNCQVLEKIGEGALTTVYKVKRDGIEEVLAAKVLRAEYGRNPRTAKRFLQEGQKAVSLNHPHLVSVYETGRTGSDEPYLLCDFVDGGNLASRLQEEGKYAQSKAIDLFLKVCDGLEQAHKNGVLHRDIKPGNLVFKHVDKAELVKLADFGIAKVLPGGGRETKYLTPFGDAFGNPTYMSPEQLQGQRIDVRSDIYSLGCVMYECICGRPPFKAENAIAVAVMQIQSEPEPLRKRMESDPLSMGLEVLIMRMLEKDPDNRIQSVQNLIDDLKLVRAGKIPRYPALIVKPAPDLETEKRSPRQIGGDVQMMPAGDFDQALPVVLEGRGPKHENLLTIRGSIKFDHNLARHSIDRSEPVAPRVDQLDEPQDKTKNQLLRKFKRFVADIPEPNVDQIGNGFKQALADRRFLLKISLASLLISFLAINLVKPVGMPVLYPEYWYRLLCNSHITAPPRFYSDEPFHDFGPSGVTEDRHNVIDSQGQTIFYFQRGHLKQAIRQAVENGVIMDDANLQGMDLSGLYLVGAELHRANLQGANLSSTNLSNANLSGANLEGAHFYNAVLRHADLRSAGLAGAKMQGADMTGCDLTGAGRATEISPENLSGTEHFYRGSVSQDHGSGHGK